MNDPGVHENINEATQDLENNPYEHEQKQEEQEEEDFLDPSRWWFASTACPLIAGTFGPMANAFSICALVQSWREYIPDGGTEAHGYRIPDPGWLLAINSISLALALIANLALLLNMARRIPFAIGQPITIVGFLLSSFLLIALVAVADTRAFRLEPAQNHALTQAFYYAIMAAGLYCVISFLLVVTVFGAMRHHYEKEFRLTISQRTLMVQTIMFMAYLLLGALVFSYVEGWHYLDAVYWADFTLLTVGIGDDFTPSTHLGRSLLFPYAIGGIVTVGLVIGSVRSMVLERGKHKMEARMIEKTRERTLKTVNPDERTIKIGWYHKVKFSQKGLSEHQRREQEFHIMRTIQKQASRRRRWTAFFASLTAALLLWLVGAYIFEKAEHGQQWSYFQSLYFSYTTLLTIGYGDMQPMANSGKPFFVLWSLLAVPTLTILISNMGDTVISTFTDLTIWASSITILPGEEGTLPTLKAGIARMSKGNLFKKEDLRVQQPPGLLPNKGKIQTSDANDTEKQALERMAAYCEEEEFKEAEEAGKEGDDLERDIHFYHYVLAKEMRAVMKDVSASPPKEYSYQDWAYFLKLIGEDEGDPERHRAPPVKAKRDGNQISLGALPGDENKGEQPNKWSWLGTRSPLMGNRNEAEWLLERLSARLEKELQKMRSPNKDEQMEPPPISMADIPRRRSGEKKDESKDERDLRKEEMGGVEKKERKDRKKDI